MQNKPQIIALFKEAGLEDFQVGHIQAMGYGNIMRGMISGFSNMNSNRMDIVNVMMLKFEEAIGFFKYNMHQSYNPIFWIEFILKLPEKILSYIQLTPPNSIMKIIQLLYWVVGFLVALNNFNLFDVTIYFW